MATKHDFLNQRRLGILLALFVCCVGMGQGLTFFGAKQVYTVDYTIEGMVWVQDAMVNLVDGAWIKDSPLGETGQLWATQGAVVNIYGGQIDDVVVISATVEQTLPTAQVTVYGSDFAVNGVPVDPETTELVLTNDLLSGVYEDGTPFAFYVDCLVIDNFYMTIQLGWITGAPEIEVSSEVVDFGQVEIGQQASAFVTVANNGTTSLILQSLQIAQGDQYEFGIVPLSQIPVTLEPEEAIEIEVVYTPLVEGPAAAVLLIGSDDPERPIIEVMLGGEGVMPVTPELTPLEQIDAIYDFYMTGLQDGTIVGKGWGKSASHKASALGHMLISARHLMNGGYERLAQVALWSVEKKTDGKCLPPDFVEGPSVPVLNAMVNDLIDMLEKQ